MAAPAYPAPHWFNMRMLLAAALLFVAGTAHAARWAAISPEDLQRKTPEMDPDAAAEILLRDITFDNSSYDAYVHTYHVVVKIYSERGIEEFSKVELPYKKGNRVRDIEARVVKADGSSVELKSKDVYDREILKADGVRAKVKSFALPGLEVGSVLEYRYTEIGDEFLGVIVVLFQSEQPSRLVRFRVKLLDDVPPGFYLRSIASNCPNMPLERNRDGYYVFERKNVPAAKEEPMQPPVFDTNMALLLYYTRESEVQPATFWKNHCKYLSKETESKAKVTKIVRSKLAEIISADDTPDAKLRKIHDYCRTKIVHRYRDTTQVSEAQREKWKPNEDASDVLKNGSGGTEDINLAFVALARAAGFDARIAGCNDRDFIAFSYAIPDEFMLSDLVAAVLVGTEWVYCSPGSTYLPLGMLPWWDSDTAVLVGDKAGAQEVRLVRGTAHTESVRKRLAQFALDEGGTLEGNVTETYTGLYEDRMKHELDAKSPKEQEDYFRDALQQYQKLAEVSDVRVENAANPVEPIKITYHLRIPEYADRTGSRLFFQPAVFQKGVPARFEAQDRRTNIAFAFRNTTIDEIQIRLPDGHQLEQASAPGSTEFGQLGAYTSKLSVRRKSNELVLNRTVEIKAVLFPSRAYPGIRAAFEEIRDRDAHTLTLRRIEAAARSVADSGTSAQTNPAPSSAP